ncbi:MAG: hypothetical protein LBE35_10335 [Clostridiales bacterium]|jgi:hypothetical protein|nr:hypothetical protein [Clostridiales bacterium]
MKLWEYLDKQVSAVTIDGGKAKGFVYMHIPADENMEDVGKFADSILIDDGVGLVEMYEDEIVNIEIISETAYSEHDKPRQAVAA